MISALLLGVLSGFVLSVPPGPLSAAVTKHSIIHDMRAGVMIALGGAVMDVLYILIAAFASSAIVAWLFDFATGNGLLLLVFQSAIVVLLVVMGVRYMRHTPGPHRMEDKILKAEQVQEEKARRLGYSSPFFIGILIAVANLASPTFIPSMISVVSYIKANGWLSPGVEDNVMYAMGFGLGTLCWFALAAKILVKHRRKFSPSILSTIYKFAGATFIVCACLLTYHVAVSTHWSGL
jgi:threonine/homoserine/homoserine lactone efflux protein